jgi:hypothetical protein
VAIARGRLHQLTLALADETKQWARDEPNPKPRGEAD